MTGALLFLAAAAVFVASALAWTGRWRSWSRHVTARVVPAGSGPDGQKRPRPGVRSAFGRLVVDTQYGPFLFEVNSAKRKAREISEALGRSAGRRP